MRLALQYDPKSITAFNNLVVLEEERGNTEAVDSLTAAWRTANADDPEAMDNLDRLLRMIESQRSKQDTVLKE